MKKDFIIVGIGASAGGLEAINEFFDHISPDTGMAFIVIQHLSPDFKSLMDELLAKHTKMPIQVVRENTPVEPNHIYLISKESNIIIDEGSIKPVERKERRSLNFPIDVFFHSLGETQRERAIGVILSGTGSDGSRGISTIKEAGGLVFVQHPDSAQFDGMPRAALETGFVDDALTPRSIAKSLMNLLRAGDTGYLLFLNPEDRLINAHFNTILDHVAIQTNVDFTEYRQTTLYRRIEKRMFLTRKSTIDEYTELIKEDLSEVDALYKEFLIGVTRFFRDKEAFDLLNNIVINKIVKDREDNTPIRIWVPGCSTGEEAYSLAILFQEAIEKYNQNLKFKIFSSDLDAHAINVASKGVFTKDISAEIEPEHLSKYFDQNLAGEWIIKKKIRDNIVFTVHDALNDPPFINMDLISCRNFMIYLKPEIQQRLLINFQFSLRYETYLFLGPSESLGKVKSAFKILNERWNIYQNVLKDKLSPATYRRRQVRKKGADIFVKQPVKRSLREEFPFQTREELFSEWLLHHYAPLSIFVNESLDVLFANGNIEGLFNFPKGPGAFNLIRMIGQAELMVIKNGIRKTMENKKTNLYKNISFQKGDTVFKIDIAFEPVTIKQLIDDTLFLIEIKIKGSEEKKGNETTVIADETAFRQERLRTLELELKQVRSEKQILVERLETTNEELQSSNEELLSANEELQSTNEELQSVNEELYTVNAELQGKVSELTLANNDMDNLLKSTGIGTIFVDKDLNIRKFTPQISKQFNLLPSDVGRKITSFVNSFSSEEIYADFEEVLKTSQKIEREIKDDSGNEYLLRLLPYSTENGNIGGAVATFINVNDLKSAIRTIESFADKFQAIFENTNSMIAIYDKKLNLLDINHVEEGYHKEDIIGKNFRELLQPDSYPVFKENFKKVQKNRKVAHFQTEVTLLTGKKKWFDNLIAPLNPNHGDERFLIMSRDATQLKIVERDVEDKAQIFNSIFKYANEHITITDIKGKILDINFTGAGLKKENTIGKNVFEITSPDDYNTLTEAIQKIKKGASHTSYYSEFHGEDGKIHWYHNFLFPIKRKKELYQMVFVTRDFTSLKKAEVDLKTITEKLESKVKERSLELTRKNQELEEVNTYLDSFVHGAAHDLRAPLTQMKGFLGLIPDIEELEDRNAAIQESLDAVNRMDRILNGLIELIDFKKNATPNIKIWNLKEVYEETFNDLKPYFVKAKSKITVDIPEDLTIPYIGAYLKSIFLNLLHNSVKYRSYSRPLRVLVSVEKKEEFIVLTVKDNGIGMDLNKYRHFLFKPFKRLTVEREGTGIGLSIINNSVRRNGGKIEVDSRIEKGATFKVYLKPYEA